MTEHKQCKWDYDYDKDFFDTECGRVWQFESETVYTGTLVYCPSCGGEILVERGYDGQWITMRSLKYEPMDASDLSPTVATVDTDPPF